ncbi:hypothetical protein [Kistimonas asteriae]|uniref:hypothetical protein n=1 Tax=Kistimonas asteriae TaxID=517724 RepID=UPI001BAE30DF|nr:hypothetical protein [Kistimonas asteriae]
MELIDIRICLSWQQCLLKRFSFRYFMRTPITQPLKSTMTKTRHHKPSLQVLLIALCMITFVHDMPHALGKENSHVTVNHLTTLICLASVDANELSSSLTASSLELIPISEQSLVTHAPGQVLLILRGSYITEADLNQNLPLSDTSASTILFALADALGDIPHQCYLSPAETRQAIGDMLATEKLYKDEDSLIFSDREMTAIHIDKENTIAISNDRHTAILGLHQLGFDTISISTWIKAPHYSEALVRMLREAPEHQLSTTYDTNSTSHPDIKKQQSSETADQNCSSENQTELTILRFFFRILLCLLLLPFGMCI